jgi:hypothetical protein
VSRGSASRVRRAASALSCAAAVAFVLPARAEDPPVERAGTVADAPEAPTPRRAPGWTGPGNPTDTADLARLPDARPERPVSSVGPDVAPADADGDGDGDGDGSDEPAARAARPRSPRAPSPFHPRGPRRSPPSEAMGPLAWLAKFRLSGLVQPQLALPFHDREGSPNVDAASGQLPPGVGPDDAVARADGRTTNGAAFRLRRTRLRLTFDDRWVASTVEIDPFPNQGFLPDSGSIARRADVTGRLALSRAARLEATAGLTDIPFGLELPEAHAARPFAERTFATRNVFPGGRDLGVGLRSVLLRDKLVLETLLANGNPVGSPSFAVQPDASRAKDLYARASYTNRGVRVALSAQGGQGEIVDPANLRVKHFGRWALGAGVVLRARLSRVLGETRFAVEGLVGRNVDRGLVVPGTAPAIPATFTAPVDGSPAHAAYVRVDQELGRFLLAAMRLETYTPDASREGNTRDALGLALVGRFGPHLRWMNEVELAWDGVRAPAAAPVRRDVTTITSTLQASF